MTRQASRVALVLLTLAATLARAEDGYDLWLRYRPLDDAAQARYLPLARVVVAPRASPSQQAALSELQRGLRGLLGAEPALQDAPTAGAIVAGTPASSAVIASLGLPLADFGRDGYQLRSVRVGGAPVTLVAANDDVGVLYGAFALLRLVQTLQPIDRLDVRSAPRVQLRVLDHWANLDGHVVRGYAGQSIWDWW